MREIIQNQLAINQETKASIEKTTTVLANTRRLLKITIVLAIAMSALNLGLVLGRTFDYF